jgi:glycosyltransferase involved in cell wall biosynthesis
MIVDPGLKLWGSERALAATLKALTDSWARVLLVVPTGAELAEEVSSAPDHYGAVEIMHAPIGNLHKRGRGARLLAFAWLATLAVKFRPARIYLNQAGLARLVLPVARLLGVRLAVHVRLLDDVPRSLALRATRRAPVDLIFVSAAMSGSISPADAPHLTVRVSYDAYVLAHDAFVSTDPKKAPFVNVGRLSHGKGIHLLIDALAHDSLSKARVDIYGEGVPGEHYAADVERRAKLLGDRVRFLGFRHDVARRLRGHRFLVLTSVYETLGRVVVEGWDAGLVPIVCADSGGAAEIVCASGAGLIFGEWTADALAETLQTAWNMPEHDRVALATAGRAWVQSELSLKNYKSALSGILF